MLGVLTVLWVLGMLGMLETQPVSIVEELLK